MDCPSSVGLGFLAAIEKEKADIREKFGFAVTRRQVGMELTQQDLAECAKIDRSYVSDIERGSRKVSMVNIEKLAAFHSMSISELFDRVEG